MVKFKRSTRTPSKYIYYSALHLCFSGLSLRKASQRLSIPSSKEIMFPYGMGFKEDIDTNENNAKE
jgi:hypothetical protein